MAKVTYSKTEYSIKAFNEDGSLHHDYGIFTGLKSAYSAYCYFALCSAIIRGAPHLNFIVNPPFPLDAQERVRPKLKMDKFEQNKID